MLGIKNYSCLVLPVKFWKLRFIRNALPGKTNSTLALKWLFQHYNLVCLCPCIKPSQDEGNWWKFPIQFVTFPLFLLSRTLSVLVSTQCVFRLFGLLDHIFGKMTIFTVLETWTYFSASLLHISVDIVYWNKQFHIAFNATLRLIDDISKEGQRSISSTWKLLTKRTHKRFMKHVRFSM